MNEFTGKIFYYGNNIILICELKLLKIINCINYIRFEYKYLLSFNSMHYDEEI